MEQAHNSLTRSATGMTPFMASNGFKPVVLNHHFSPLRKMRSLFPPSRLMSLAARRCGDLPMIQRSQHVADRLLVPHYQPGQRVWLSSWDLPLQVDSRKLAPLFVRPFEVAKIINPSAFHLKLPTSLGYIGKSPAASQLLLNPGNRQEPCILKA